MSYIDILSNTIGLFDNIFWCSCLRDTCVLDICTAVAILSLKFTHHYLSHNSENFNFYQAAEMHLQQLRTLRSETWDTKGEDEKKATRGRNEMSIRRILGASRLQKLRNDHK